MYQSEAKLEGSPTHNQMTSISQDMKALTAEKERNPELADTLNKDLKSLDQQNRRIESQAVVGFNTGENSKTEKQDDSPRVQRNRKGGHKYRVRRQDVKFMKRGARYDDNKSDAPLSVPSASWQRYQTVDQQSNSSSINVNSQSVSISRTSGFN